MKAFVVALCCLLPVLRAQEESAPFPMPSGDEEYVALSAVQKPFSDEEKAALHALVENRLQQLEKMIPDVRLATDEQLQLLRMWEEAYRFAEGREEVWFAAICSDQDEGFGRSEFAVDYRYDLALMWSLRRGDDRAEQLLSHRFRSSVQGRWIEEVLGAAGKLGLIDDAWRKASTREAGDQMFSAFRRAFPGVMPARLSKPEQMAAARRWYEEAAGFASFRMNGDYAPVNGRWEADGVPLFLWKAEWGQFDWPEVTSPDGEYVVLFCYDAFGAAVWDLYVFRRMGVGQYEHVAAFCVCTRYASVVGRDENEIEPSVVFRPDGLEFLLEDEKGIHRHLFPYASEVGSWCYRVDREDVSGDGSVTEG